MTEYHDCLMCPKGTKGNWYVIYGCINKHITEGWRCGRCMLRLKRWMNHPETVSECSDCLRNEIITPFIADMVTELLGNWGD